MTRQLHTRALSIHLTIGYSKKETCAILFQDTPTAHHQRDEHDKCGVSVFQFISTKD